jgi:hypothetical protein
MKSIWFMSSAILFTFLGTGCESDKAAKPTYQPDFFGLGQYGGEIYQTRLPADGATESALRAMRALPVKMLPVAAGAQGPVAAVELSGPAREPRTAPLFAEVKVTTVQGSTTTLIEIVVFEQLSGMYPSGKRHNLMGHPFYKEFEIRLMDELRARSKS